MVIVVCEWCGSRFELPARGRIPKYCSTRCRVAAHRARKRTESTAIPDELRRVDRWVRWRTITRNGKPTKLPICVDGRVASSTDPTTWTDYDRARVATAGDGIGFVLDGDGVVCVDLDGCLRDGQIVGPARLIVDQAPDTYIEISPSGNGLHLWGYGHLERGRVRPGIEVYGDGRYITVTGRPWSGAPSRLGDITGLVASLIE